MAGSEEGAGEGLVVGVDLLAHLPGDPVPALEDLHEEVLHGRLPAVAEVAGGEGQLQVFNNGHVNLQNSIAGLKLLPADGVDGEVGGRQRRGSEVEEEKVVRRGGSRRRIEGGCPARWR